MVEKKKKKVLAKKVAAKKPMKKTVQTKAPKGVLPKTQKPTASNDLFMYAMQKDIKQVKEGKKEFKDVAEGMGLFGVIGVSVLFPTILGVAIGRWLDNYFMDAGHWTLIFLVIGLVIGVISATIQIKNNLD